MLYRVSECVFFIDHAAAHANSYREWQPNWQPTTAAQPSTEQGTQAQPPSPHPTDAPTAGLPCQPNPQPTDSQALSNGGVAAVHTAAARGDGNTESAASASVPRRRKRKAHSSAPSGTGADGAGCGQQGAGDTAALDARHPGNVRNRAAQQVVTAAFNQYLSWLASSRDRVSTVQQTTDAQRAIAAPASHNGVQAAQVPAQQDLAMITGARGDEVAVSACARRPPAAALRRLSQVPRRSEASGPACTDATAQSESHSKQHIQSMGHASEQQGAAEQHAEGADQGLDADAHTDTGDTDWIALAALKRTVKPKFSFLPPRHQAPAARSSGASSARPWNLYDRVIRNESACECVGRAHETSVLVPGHSGFLMTDLAAKGCLTPLIQECDGFDVIVCDPPWENASARRSGRYPTLPNRALLHLPIAQLLDQDTGLVLLWMTNREKLHRFLHDELLSAWGLEHVATWYWLKLTDGGLEPTSSLTSMHRHPFETVILAAPPASAAQLRTRVPQDLVLLSVPPAEHSRKPHLGPLLSGLGLWHPHTPDPDQLTTHTLVRTQSVQTHEQAPCAAHTGGTVHTFDLAQMRTESGQGSGECVPGHESGINGAYKAPTSPVYLSREEDGSVCVRGPVSPRLPDPSCRGAHTRVSLRGLELFARELHSQWLGVGNEPLRFQSLDLFTPVHGEP